jgi:TOMM system kinase/cyclase fusion protein
MHCASCGTENPPNAKFCNECGTALTGKPEENRGTEEPEKRGREQRRKRSRRQPSLQTLDARHQTLDASREAREGERRQLTVMFCDLVGSTALSTQLDPEELREVIQAYRATCATVIHRFDGYLAKYIGDGLLVYFGYPLAHEDDAQRAVRAGLSILAELSQLNARLQSTVGAHSRAPLQIRIGIHTGLVVAGEMGVGDQPEPLAIVGETPNIAARLQGLAEPNTVMISAATYHLIQGYFECADLGLREVKGVPTPLQVYRVLGESEVQSRLEVVASRGLTPLVGREQEVRLLLERWERVKEGQGQVVLLSGEAGIGKSRLLQVLREREASEAHTRLECRCSPYYQNTALYPVIDLLQRVLRFSREDSPEEKLSKLEQALVGAHSRAPQHDAVPLLASLLSLPLPDRYPPLTLTPQKQKEKTQQAVLMWLLQEAERQPVRFDVEDLHWADPSMLEFLGLLIDQAPTPRLLVVLTFRPEFRLLWPPRSHVMPITLSRLVRAQTEAMIERVTGGKALPAEILQQIVSKTDGVPLFVEELTKMVLESGAHVGATHALPAPLGIPATLQDALMARLDRLAAAKEVAQLGATLGREFSYELLHAVSLVDEASLQQALAKLVEAEVLYQRGLPPQARYLFKHALVQDAAYQSLLKSKRQQYHQQIAQVLEERFPETKEIQPELLAHHYTEAGLITQAIPFWQRAGQRAVQRSANAEAISHLTKGLEWLKTLPDTPERAQQELTLQLALGIPLMTTKGWAAQEVEQVYTRARELCRQVGETPQLFPVMWGLWVFYTVRGEHKMAHELGEQLLTIAQSAQDSALLLQAHHALGPTLFSLGELGLARAHLEEAIALYDPQQHRSHAFVYGGHDPGMCCCSYASFTLWLLGYPDQSLESLRKGLTLAQKLSHPFSLAQALYYAAWLHQLRREGQATQEQAEAAIRLSTEPGFASLLGVGTFYRGWALAEAGQGEEGIAQMQQRLAAFRAMGTEMLRSYHLAMLAEACGQGGQAEEGLSALSEALMLVNKTGERWYEAELYRLKGELTLAQSSVQKEAEECFLKAIEIACRQQAKSLELRAVMSLSRLWQQQGKKAEARHMLAEIYD